MTEPTSEKAQTPDCKCPVPDHDMRGTCKRCDGFACEYADRGQTRCPAWRCDCFIETHPFDNPRGLHPEAFVVAPLNPPVLPEGHEDRLRDTFLAAAMEESDDA